jgi:uncharacterized protein (TIGR03083 family)
MQTQTPKQQDLAGVVGAIRREYEVLDRWLRAVSPAHWQGATYCDEWTVQKTVSHLGSGAEIHQLTIQENVDGAEPTTQETRERIWGHFDSLAPEPLHADFRDRNERYLTYLEQLPAEKHGRIVKFFAGERPVAGYARYRLFELALHAWDLRWGLDPTARLLPTSVEPLWPIAWETLDRRANKDAKAALAGTSYSFAVYGPLEQQFALAVGDGKVELRDGPAGTAAASLRLPAEAFIRLYTGRFPLEPAEAEGEVTIAGDRTAALRLNALFPGF